MSDGDLIRGILAQHGDAAVEAARRGDPDELIGKVESGANLTERERTLLVELLEATRKDRAERQHSLEIRVAASWAMAHRRGDKKEAWLSAAAAHFNLSRRRLFHILADAEKNSDARAWVEYLNQTNELD